MKLAYLIVAHHQPNHLARLIQALNDENSYFFIHIDGKVPLAPFTAVVPQHANIVFLPNRVEVQWGKLNVVHALLNLIQTAVASDHAFKYYTVLSGSDYPIKHKQEIYTRLQASDCQFLRIDRKLTNEANNSHRHFIKDLPQGKYFGNLTPHHGSMYWSLSADCIRFILDFVHNNPAYVEIYHHIFAPDEVFFHTLVKHSPFAGAITHDFSDGSYPDHTHHGNHFINWIERHNRMYLTLDEGDIDDLLASTALFARKFDEQKSSKLLDLLDTHIHFAHTTRMRHEMGSAIKEAKACTMERQPAVSCICLTYARPALLEEAIYSFLQQEYAGPKELIVLNDYVEQILTFEHPEVRLINLPKRLRTVGEKMNLAVALASHDLLFVWDDDDIYLPHRLAFSAAKFETTQGFFKPNRGWVLDRGSLSGPAKNLFHAGSCWSRRLFDAVRGYPGEGTGYDLVFERRLRQQFPDALKPYAIRPEEIYYIYRWGGTDSYHMSGFGSYKAGENVGHDQVEEFVQQRASRGEIHQGHIPLQPRWNTDYRQLVSSHIAALAEQQAQERKEVVPSYPSGTQK